MRTIRSAIEGKITKSSLGSQSERNMDYKSYNDLWTEKESGEARVVEYFCQLALGLLIGIDRIGYNSTISYYYDIVTDALISCRDRELLFKTRYSSDDTIVLFRRNTIFPPTPKYIILHYSCLENRPKTQSDSSKPQRR